MMAKATPLPQASFTRISKPVYVTRGAPNRPMLKYFMTPRFETEALDLLAATLVLGKPTRKALKAARKQAKGIFKQLLKKKLLLRVKTTRPAKTIRAFKGLRVEQLDFDIKDEPVNLNGLIAVGYKTDVQIVAQVDRFMLDLILELDANDLPDEIKKLAQWEHLDAVVFTQQVLAKLPELLSKKLVYLTPVKEKTKKRKNDG